MTLNDIARRNSPYFAFLRNLTYFQANYITVVEDRPILSVNIISQFQSSTFGENYNASCRGLSAIAENLVIFLPSSNFTQFSRYRVCDV